MWIKFDYRMIGKDLQKEYGIDSRFKVFRYAYKRDWETAEAFFLVKFQLQKMSVKRNKRFSVIPMLFLIHFKGFCSKYWLCDEATNECMGVYHWKTVSDAKRYANGIAMRFMRKRSVPESVSYQILKKPYTANTIL